MSDSAQIVKNAFAAGVAIPSFNIPYLPMLKPVVRAVVDQDSFAFISVARLEWIKFESGSVQAVREVERIGVDLEHGVEPARALVQASDARQVGEDQLARGEVALGHSAL